MAEQLHKSWLNTRENEKFAPATLATQIYNEDGISFYRTVSNYIEAQEALSDAVENLTTVGVADLRTDLNAEIETRAAKGQELKSRLQYFNGDADDAFYIIDKNQNVKEGGVYSTNFTLKDGRNLVTLYDDYERILANAETYNTFNTIETWIEGAIETLKSHTQSLKDLGDSIEDIVEAVGLPSDEANYPGYETKPANLYEAVIENRTDINVLNREVTQEGSIAKAIKLCLLNKVRPYPESI